MLNHSAYSSKLKALDEKIQHTNYYSMNASEVIRVIEDAWRDVPYPGDDKIFTPDSYDDEGIVNYFSGTTWHGHSPTDLRCHSSAFTFFVPEAFHYWFPAFMIAAIQDPEEADVVIDRILSSLSNCYASERWPLFTHAQKQAVAAYLRFQIERLQEDSKDEQEVLRILENTA